MLDQRTVRFGHVKWSGAYQDGAGLTLGEEVEQCNAFLSRIAVTTKHMSKAVSSQQQQQPPQVMLMLWPAELVLVASIKRHSQRLYKDTDGNKGRARIRRKIREEKGILTSVVEKYNIMVPKTETLCLETILSELLQLPVRGPYTDRRSDQYRKRNRPAARVRQPNSASGFTRKLAAAPRGSCLPAPGHASATPLREPRGMPGLLLRPDDRVDSYGALEST
ncbi:hypothetical protein C0J50_20806 [Silurus asotus]|uniref:Uncharacterized protein n=1 Tax=Silurus asotus TaxID=30991 RepID=A0AAD5AQD9_SILAS|nr:hypothetical protein C0J50_20806 [Silurus asotus]